LWPASEEDSASCPACDPDPDSNLCIPETSPHLLLSQSSPGLSDACLAAAVMMPAPLGKRRILNIGFV